MIVFGTRPEAIKVAPLVKQFQVENGRFETIVCVTAQHREMMDQVLKLFEIYPQYDLDIMTINQTLSGLTSKMLPEIISVMEKEKPAVVFVQGDTTTTFVSSLAAYYLKIPVAHIEAGLRTKDKFSPFPEEINRRITSVLADYHFAPTKDAERNLIKEGVASRNIYITGNTVIDALKYIIKKQRERSVRMDLEEYFRANFGILFSDDIRTILVTGHRRENFGDGFRRICRTLVDIAKCHKDLQLIYPVHLNPNVQKPVYSILGNVDNVYLIPPLDYAPFAFLMNKSYLILTDSGGIQEEAPLLGKPVLVLRDTTERNEGIVAGTAKLVGTHADIIRKETERLLTDPNAYTRMAQAINPYGDGTSSKSIVEIIKTIF
jgi:UDP-N-acetylglucosamine 2-epimerase (non-hydrolysing)